MTKDEVVVWLGELGDFLEVVADTERVANLEVRKMLKAIDEAIRLINKGRKK